MVCSSEVHKISSLNFFFFFSGTVDQRQGLLTVSESAGARAISLFSRGS